METFALSTLLFQSLAFVTLALCVAAGACQRGRTTLHGWTMTQTLAPERVEAAAPQAVELPRAA
ncbi:MAG TPA: hypothetical protein VMH77_00725 [Steroidobacteraceae bacterium]|nr:hypothetical protein [Steroidobacteraceae bacterium]